MKKFIITLLAIIIIILLFLGTFWNKGKKDNTKKITVAEVAHSIFYAPMYVADKLGYFDSEGLDVEIILTSGADAVAAAILSGDVEIGLCGSEQSIYIYNQGEKDYLVNFAGLTKRDGSFIVSRTDEDFKLENLKGKHIIAGRQAGMPAMTLAYTLHENGIELDELEFDTSIAFASMTGAFIGGTGDYVTVFEPTGLLLEKNNNGYVVESLGKLGGVVPYTTFSAKKSYIKENSDVIESFTNAIQKGIDYTLNNSDDDVATLLLDYFPDNSLNDIKEAVKRYREADSWFDTTYITEDGFNRVKEIMEFNNVLDKDVDYDILVDNKYNKKM